MQNRNLPIGVFDSGVGGISVLSALSKALPNENFIYYGDSAHAPYGTKTPEEVLFLSRNALKALRRRHVKAFVIACNTATAAAAETLRAEYPDLPIIGVEPAIKPAARHTDHPRVLIMATPMTLHLDKFKKLADSLKEEAEFITLPCPGLVELIEAGKKDDPETESYLRTLLGVHLDDPPDAVVLGCTHYPFVKEQLRRLFGQTTRLFDGAEGTARQLQKRLCENGLLTSRETKGKIVFSGTKEETLPLMRSLYESLL